MKSKALVLLPFVLLFFFSFGNTGDRFIRDSPEVVPAYLWTAGCTPTAATMVVAYWDWYSPLGKVAGFGNIVQYSFEQMVIENYYDRDGDYYDFSSSDGTYGIPAMVHNLAWYMKTDAPRGGTSMNYFITPVADAIEDWTNDYWGYDFGTYENFTIWNYEHVYNMIKDEVDGDCPCVWSREGKFSAHSPPDEVIEHSVAVIGYNSDNDEVIYRSTWDFGYHKDPYQGIPVKQFADLARVYPGGEDPRGDIDLFVPDGGENWAGGSVHDIRWYQWGTYISSVRLYCSFDRGYTWSFIDETASQAGWNNYPWVVPNEDLSDVFVRIEGYLEYGPPVYIFSDGTEELFSTFKRSITVISPKALDSWEKGQTYSIEWSSLNIPSNESIRIALFMAGYYLWDIVGNTPNDGIYSWQVPSNLGDRTDYRIRIYVVDSPSINDFSEEFAIQRINAPSALDINPNSYSSMELLWQDNSQTNTGFIFQYRIDNDPWYTPAEQPEGDVTSFLVRYLEPGEKYSFRIKAVDDYGNESDWSDIAGPMRLGGVRDFTPIPGHETVFLSWKTPDPNKVTFPTKSLIARAHGNHVSFTPVDGEIYHIGDPAGNGIVVFVGDNNQSQPYDNAFKDSNGLINDHTYYYMCYAYSENIEGTCYTSGVEKSATPANYVGNDANVLTFGNNGRRIAVSALNGNPANELIHIVYTEKVAQNYQVMYAYSDNQGEDWIQKPEWAMLSSLATERACIAVRDHITPENDSIIKYVIGSGPCWDEQGYWTENWYAWHSYFYEPGEYWEGPYALLSEGHYSSWGSIVIDADTAYVTWSGYESGMQNFKVMLTYFDIDDFYPGDPMITVAGPGGALAFPSIAVNRVDQRAIVHVALQRGTYNGGWVQNGKISHRYGWDEDGIWQWMPMTNFTDIGFHPSLVSGLEDSVFLVYHSRIGANNEDFIVFRSFGNGIWSDPEIAADLPTQGAGNSYYYPEILHYNEDCYVIWEEPTPDHDFQIFYKERNENGEWSDKVNISGEISGSICPSIAFSIDHSKIYSICTHRYEGVLFRPIDLIPFVEVDPVAGGICSCGDEIAIEWEAHDNTNGMIVGAIEYTTNGGETWIVIAENEEDDGIYQWLVPNTPSENCRIRVTVRDFVGNEKNAESEVFVIQDVTPPEVVLYSPNGGEQWSIGNIRPIHWRAIDNVLVSSQELYYSEDNGSSWTPIEMEGQIQQPNGDEYFFEWTIPLVFSEECMIKVIAKDISNNSGEDISDDNFVLGDFSSPEVTVIEPNGGEMWEINDSQYLTWRAVDNVSVTGHDLYFSTNMGVTWNELNHGPIGQTNGIYSCEWLIPEVYSTNCAVLIISHDEQDNFGTDVCDTLFTISDFTPPNVTVIRANGGENIEVGSEYVIAWDAVDNGTIEDHYLWYSTSAGVEWMEIPLAHPPQQGSYIYPWDVPGNPSMKCLLKARSYDAAENYGEDISDGLFRISWYVSNNTDATGYSPKVVKSDNKLHLVYTSNDSIYYAQSEDDGETFERKFFIGLGAYPTVISNGDANLYILWTNGEQLFYRRSDGEEWQSSVLLSTISSVTELRQVIGCLDDEDQIQMGFEGMYRMGRGIESNIAFHGIMARNDPNTFEYDAIAINEKPDESATISFDLDMYGTAYLVFSYRGEVRSYSNERGYWGGEFIVGEGRNGYIDSYDGYIHVVWEDYGIIKHRHRLIRSASWFSTETVSSDISKYYRHPIFDKGCVAVYTEIPQLQPDHVSNIVYRIRDRGIWQKQEYLTEGLNADYPQLFIEDYRDYNAKLYATYTEATFALSSIGIAKKEITIPHQTSDILQATAYNFQDKMVLDSDSVIHIVYQDKVNIVYAYSEDGGEIFSEDVILGEGRAPVITLLPNDEIGVLWTLDGGEKRVIFRKGIKEEWGPPFHIFKSIDHFALLPVNFMVDDAGIAYVSLEMEELLTGGYAWRLYYGSFDTDDPEFIPPGDWLLIDEYEASYPPPPPPSPMPPSPASSDICFANNLLHLVWSRPDGMVLYSNTADGSYWTPKYEVSRDLELSYHPSINVFENRLGCVWQAGAAPEIFYSYTDDYQKWSNPLKISSTEANSFCPILAENAFIVWSEENEEGFGDLFMSRFDRAFWTNQQITETESYASYPHDIIEGYPAAWLGILYTEGTEYPFNVTYKPEQVDIPWWTSNTREATASNSQHKLVIDDNGMLHLVFESDGHILYTTSTDGEKWALEHYIGEGISPAIGLDSEGKPSCVWVNKPASANDPYKVMYCEKKDGEWTAPYPLYTSYNYVEAPSYVIQTIPGPSGIVADTGFVAFEHGYTFVPDEHSQIIFGKFALAGAGQEPWDLITEVIDDVVGARGVKTPSLSISETTVHLAYERDWEIIYTRNYIRRMMIPPRRYWSPKAEVSPINMAAINPCVDCSALGFNIVWEGEGDIYHIRCNLAGEPGLIGLREYWGEVENVSQSPNLTSLSPVVCAGSQILWCEEDEQQEPYKSEIYFSRFNGRTWTTPECITKPEASESHPQVATRSNELCCAFTRGDENPYILASRCFATEIKEVFSGIIEQDITWDEDRYILGGAWINGDAAVTIDPGVNVYFLPSYTKPRGYLRRAPFEVAGMLVAEGLETDSITFTSSKMNGEPGDWNYLKLNNPNKNSVLSYCRIQFGEGIFIDGATPFVERCNIRNNLGRGILVQNCSATISKSIISDNTQAGIMILGIGSPYIYGNEIFNNRYGIEADAMVLVVDNPDIDSNYIHDNDLDGIQSNMMNLVVRRNKIEGNGENGIRYIECEAEITANSIIGNMQNGIYCQGSPIPVPPGSSKSIRGNTVSSNKMGGILCIGHVEELIIGNIITENWNYGVKIGAGAYVNLGNLENSDPDDDGGNYIYDNIMGGAEPGWDVMNHTPNEVMAQGNFWGAVDPHIIDSHIYDDNENPLCGPVNFEGYYVSGELTQDETWSGIVSVCGDVYVPHGITLSIVEGTIVRFAANYDINNIGVDAKRSELIVDGKLEIIPTVEQAFGNFKIPESKFSKLTRNNALTEGQDKGGSSKIGIGEPDHIHHPVVFTSDAFDPHPSDWYGIELGGLDMENKGERSNAGKVRRTGFEKDERGIRDVHYCDVRYAKRGLALCEGEMLSMKNCTFKSNEGGFKLRGYSDVSVKDCNFKDNTLYGVLAGDGVTGTIKDDTISANGMGITFMGNASCDIKNVILEGNGTGLHLAGTSDPTVKESEIINSVDFGVYITDDAHPNLGGCGHNYIYGSGQYDLYNSTDNDIMAKKNYWGTMDLDTIAKHIYDYYDDSSLGKVMILPLWDGNRGGMAAMSSEEEKLFVYALKNASPNPLKSNTTIYYSIGNSGYISLCIYDISGRLVRILVDEIKARGSYSVHWDGRNNSESEVACGTYFLRMQSGDFACTKKLLVVK
jgi:hypothetical protein